MYKIEAVFDGEAIGNGVIAPITITNGINDIDQHLTQFYCNVTVFRKKFEEVFTAAGKDVRFYGLGSVLQIELTSTGESTPDLIFDGVVTDTSSNADTVTFTAIDKDIITLSRNKVNWSGSAVPLRLCEYLELLATNAGVTGWYEDPLPSVQPYLMWPTNVSTDPIRTESTAYAMNALAQDGFYSIARVNVPTVKTDANHGVGKLYNMRTTHPAPITTLAELDLTDNIINKNYDLKRGAFEIANRVTIEKADNTLGSNSTVNDVTSQNNVGVLTYSRTSYLYTQAERDFCAQVELSRRSDVGWPVIDYTISYDRVSSQFTNELDCYETVVPACLVDVSAITEPYTQEAALILQVTHSFYEKYWEMRVSTIDAYASGGGVRWNQIDDTRQWADVSDEITWDMARSIEI